MNFFFFFKEMTKNMIAHNSNEVKRKNQLMQLQKRFGEDLKTKMDICRKRKEGKKARRKK